MRYSEIISESQFGADHDAYHYLRTVRPSGESPKVSSTELTQRGWVTHPNHSQMFVHPSYRRHFIQYDPDHRGGPFVARGLTSTDKVFRVGRYSNAVDAHDSTVEHMRGGYAYD